MRRTNSFFYLHSSHEHRSSWSRAVVVFAMVLRGGRWRVSVLKLEESMGTLGFTQRLTWCFPHIFSVGSNHNPQWETKLNIPSRIYTNIRAGSTYKGPLSKAKHPFGCLVFTNTLFLVYTDPEYTDPGWRNGQINRVFCSAFQHVSNTQQNCVLHQITHYCVKSYSWCLLMPFVFCTESVWLSWMFSR